MTWKVAPNGWLGRLREFEDQAAALAHALIVADDYGEAVVDGGDPKRTFVIRRLLTEDYE